MIPSDESYLEAMKQEYALLNYEPSPTQLAFHQSNANNRLLTTGGRGGKTSAAMAEVSWLATGTHPYKANHNRPLSILILSLTRQNASQVVQRKLFEASELMGAIGGKPFIPENELMEGEHTPLRVGFPTYYRVKLRTGTIIEFAWSDDPKSFIKVQGSKRDLIYLDEARCDRKLFIELQKRLLDARSEAVRGLAPPWLGGFIWGATATEDSDSFDDFRDRCDDPKFPDHELFLIKPGETGAIDAAVTAQLAATMSEDEQAVHIHGTESAGAVDRIYPQFNEDRHLMKEDWIPRPCDNLWLGYDPGWDHPTAMTLICITPERPQTKLVVHCWKHSRKTHVYDVECLKHYLRGRRLAGVIYDWNANAGQKNSVPLLTSIKDEFKKQNMEPLCGWFKGKKNNKLGIPLVQRALDPDPYNPNATPFLYLNTSPESGCRLLAVEFRKYKGRAETKFSGPNGVIKKWDDLCDSLKYLISANVAQTYNADFCCGSISMADVPMSVRPETMLSHTPVILTPHDVLMERYANTRALQKARRLPMFGTVV